MTRPAGARLLALAALVLIAAAALSLLLGARTVAPATVVDALVAPDVGNGDHLVVLARIPRTLCGLLVGAALAAAGCAMQGLTRNPIADPGILGISGGAALAVVIGMAVAGIASVLGYLGWALAGAALASALVYGVATAAGGGPVALVLSGTALTMGLASLTSGVLVLSQGALDRFRFWQVGSLVGRDAGDLLLVAPLLLIGVLMVLAAGRSFDALALGDDVARSLGVRLGLLRGATAAAIVLLCGGATALAGPIGFVGLIVPHAARLLSGRLDHRSLVALSLLLGPALVLAADVIGRVAAPPGEIPVGVLTAVVGVPLFVVLVRTGRRVMA